MSEADKADELAKAPPPKPALCAGCPEFKEVCVTSGDWNPAARITFLSDTPSWASIGSGIPLTGKNGILLRKIVQSIESAYKDKFPRGMPYSTAYAVGALGNPAMPVVQKCSELWKTQWASHYSQQAGTHVIVPFGMIAAKSAGIMAKKVLDVRGRVQQRVVGTKQVQVVPTLSLQSLYVKPGLAAVIQQDILRAVKLAYLDEYTAPKSIEELSKGYIFPKTIEEVRKVCDDIIAYYDPEKQSGPLDWPITVDIETNTLKAFRKDAKIIMISFAWDDGKAAAILLNHMENTWYDPAEAWKEVARVLECPKPKAAHNGKFDAPFIERLQGIKINNIVWDTLCGQHWLSEDQKGVYGLKALTPTYAPEYEGYEDRLHDALRHGEEVAPTEEDILKEAQELMAASGCVSDSTWLEGGDIPDEAEIEEEQANNDKWLVDPVWPEGAIEADVQAYKELRDLWFTLDAAGSGKERGVAWRRWKKLAKKMGLPEPTPTPAKEMSKDAGGFEGVAVNTLLPYAAADADVTRIILKKQYRKLRVTGVWDEAHSVMRNLYIPASRALGDLEYRGVKVDLNKALDYDSQLTVVLDTTQQRIYNLALRHFKINASHQLAEVLNNMGFRTDQRTKNDQVKTSKDVIVGYQKEMVAALQTASETDKPHLLRRLEFLESLMLYKAAQKMKTSFIRRLREYASLDGHIHTTFHLTGTSSGRLSSSKLNLQNLPAYMCRISRPNPADPENPVVVHSGFNVKALLIPENDEEVFWNLDIKAAEIRVAAYYSGDAGLIQALNDGLDVHTFFLTKIKHPTFDDAALRQQYGIYKQAIDQGDEELSNLRSAVKRVVFGTLYGAGPRKIASQIGENFPVEEAKKIIDALFTAFPGIKKYVQETKSEVKLKGQVSTIFGRYRRFMLAAVSSELRSKSEREAVNFKIQSTSSDLVVSQLCEINDHLHEIEAVMRLTVHDSMAGTIKKSRVKDMKAFFDYWLVDRVKERFPWMPVPFLYDLEVGPSYGEKMKYKDWVKEHAAA